MTAESDDELVGKVERHVGEAHPEPVGKPRDAYEEAVARSAATRLA